MDVRDAFAITSASVRTHKVRSALAAIGVVLGIASVIGITTLGAGIQESILGSFTSEFDADLIAIGLESPQTANGPPTRPNVMAFTDRDLDALAALPGVAEWGAGVPVPQSEVTVNGEGLAGVLVTATRGASFANLEAGRLAANDGEALASNLTALRLMAVLGTSDVLGTSLTLRYPDPDGGFLTSTVTLVGIEKPSSFGAAESITVSAAYAPLSPVDGTPTRVWQAVGLRAVDANRVAEVKTAAQTYLETESDAMRLKGERLDFRFDTQAEVAALITTSISQFTLFIGAIGAVALVVGMVGIANIMLVSVQERTREIGVMKATGATRGDIVLIFLVESALICTAGAVMGIALGSFMGLGLGKVVQSFSGSGDPFPFVYTPEWYAIAVLMGVGVGLVAGLYPAWKGAKVSPVEALRYE